MTSINFNIEYFLLISGPEEVTGYDYPAPTKPFTLPAKTTKAPSPPPTIRVTQAPTTRAPATTQPPTYLPPVDECGPDSLDLKCCGKGSKNPACNPTTTPRPTTTTQRPTTTTTTRRITTTTTAR